MSNKCINKLIVSFLRIVLVLCLISYIPITQAKHILVFGDSLSAAYGIDIDKGWVSLLNEQLDTQRSKNEPVNAEQLSLLENDNLKSNNPNHFQVSNASISGETTTGGLARLQVTLNEIKPDIVLLELGANDGLQGQPTNKIIENLNSMIDIIEKHGAQTAIIGVSLPASYGPRYVDQFRSVFPSVAKARQLPFLDLYREDFYLKQGFMQSDGLHPTELAQPTIRDIVFEFLLQAKLI